MMESREEILEEAGRELRGARRARGWTLRDVGTRSDGQFKPTAVAGYERGERGISLERFCSLAQLYGMHPERLLSRIMWRIGGGPEPKIDRSRLAQLPEEEAGTVGEFIDEVRRLRGDVEDETISVPLERRTSATAPATGRLRRAAAPGPQVVGLPTDRPASSGRDGVQRRTVPA